MLDGLKRAKEIVETEIHCQMSEEDTEFIIRGLRIALKIINIEIRYIENEQ